MRKTKATACPSCERPVAVGAAQCPYCGEPLPGRRDPAEACLALAALAGLCAALAAFCARPLPWDAVSTSLGFGYGRPVSSVLSGLAALLLFLPLPLPASGAPFPVRARDAVFGILWRVALLVDGALFAALLAEDAADGAAALLPVSFLAICAGAIWRLRLGWRAFAALALLVVAGIW